MGGGDVVVAAADTRVQSESKVVTWMQCVAYVRARNGPSRWGRR